MINDYPETLIARIIATDTKKKNTTHLVLVNTKENLRQQHQKLLGEGWIKLGKPAPLANSQFMQTYKRKP